MSSFWGNSSFKEVAGYHNVTQAAKHLHISQPSVSIQIQNLEQEYNVTLLERTNRGVLLTECGEIFYQYISQVIQAMREAQEVMLEHEAKQHRNVHVGATLTIGEYVVPFIADAMYHEHPQINLNVKVANTANMAEEVLDKQLHSPPSKDQPTNPDSIIENSGPTSHYRRGHRPSRSKLERVAQRAQRRALHHPRARFGHAQGDGERAAGRRG